MEIRDTTRIVGLLGYPVSHSLSPAMHNEGFRQLNIDAEYILMPTPPADLPAAVEKLRDPKYLGANVTLPHKTAVIPLLDGVSERSRLIGAVNTIINDNGKLFGDTTDPEGFLNAAAANAGSPTTTNSLLHGKTVAILGNGGSARTIAFALVLWNVARRVLIVGRDSAKSENLANEIKNKTGFQDISGETFGGFASVSNEYDVIVNTTPIGMHPNVDATPLPAEVLRPGQIVYDIVYNPEETRLLREAHERGCQTVGGLGMLVHQGLLSFLMWTGKAVGSPVFLEGIRKHRSTAAGASA